MYKLNKLKICKVSLWNIQGTRACRFKIWIPLGKWGFVRRPSHRNMFTFPRYFPRKTDDRCLCRRKRLPRWCIVWFHTYFTWSSLAYTRADKAAESRWIKYARENESYVRTYGTVIYLKYSKYITSSCERNLLLDIDFFSNRWLTSVFRLIGDVLRVFFSRKGRRTMIDLFNWQSKYAHMLLSVGIWRHFYWLKRVWFPIEKTYLERRFINTQRLDKSHQLIIN